MRRAIERRPEEKPRRITRRSGYFPHYYLGLAGYHLGDCARAVSAWAESERQGAIVGQDEYAELLRLQADCKKAGRPTLAARPLTSAAGSKPDRKTGKEKVRTGQHLVEKGADPTRKTLSSLEKIAPNSELGEAARKGQEAVGVLESATDLVDLAWSASKQLVAAIDAYFAGNPQQTLELLREADLSDPRARAQVFLFRAAASFRLHLLAGRDASHLRTARQSADRFQQEQWRGDFPSELFDPRFVRFLRGAVPDPLRP